MGSDNDDLWKQTAQLLRRRPGWTIEAVSTPGMPTYWCFARGSKAQLLVEVESGSINVQLVDADQPVTLNKVSDLVAWLQAHRPDSLHEPKMRFIDKLKARKLFTWE